MDKNKKGSTSQQKTRTLAHDKISATHDTSSKNIMGGKSDAKSEKDMPSSSGKSAMGVKTSKGK
jgi:hypothetical protein